jgi:hypothetical protein
MPITLDDIIQTNTGSFNATSGTVTLPSGTTDGSAVIVCIMGYVSVGSPVMSGFTRDHGTMVGSPKPYIMRKANVAAGENSWTMTGFSSASPAVWVAMEIQNVSRLYPLEINSTVTTSTTGTSIPSGSGPTGLATSYDTLAIAFHGGQNTASSTIATYSGQTGDFVEWQEVSRVDGATATSAVVSVKLGTDAATYTCTVTASTTINGNGVIAVYNAEGARRTPNIDVMTGLEFGTAAGHKTGIATGGPPFDASNGTVTVTSTNPASGSYCLELSGSAAQANVSWTSTGALSLYPAPTGLVARQQYVAGFRVLFPSSLPGSDVRIAALDAGTGTSAPGVQVTYRTASQKIGVLVADASAGAGTEQLSATTVAADTWYHLDLYLDMSNGDRGQTFHAYWTLDDVAQTTATQTTLTATTVATFTNFTLGWLTSTTATVRFDDIVGSKHPGHYPFGSVRIYGLAVDPAATPTVTTATSFSTMTANGTLNATFSATTARDAVDDIPPTVGASADGFVQDTISSTDYVELPMATRAAATNLQALRGVRWYFCGWAAGNPAAATIGFRGWDGTTETTLFATADPSFTNSTTTPSWLCRMHRDLASATPYLWTQALLDALAARVGFSGDVTPVIGINAVLAEVAMRDAAVTQVSEQDSVIVYALLDPDTGNIIAYTLDATAAAATAAATYTIGGSPVNRTAAAGTTDTYVIGEESHTVSFVTGGLQ